jgi:hypothetical protein
MDDLDKPTESSEQRAARMWGNHDLTRRFLEEKRKAPPVPAPPKVVEVLTTERVKAEETTKFERKFIKDLRAMLDEHKRRNLLAYKLSLRAQIHRLKAAKLRKLQARAAQRD